MTEIITTKPDTTICKTCGLPCLWVTVWTGQRILIERKKINIIHQVNEKVWTTTSGHLSHIENCQKAKGGQIESNDN
jgi:hypothetical protein